MGTKLWIDFREARNIETGTRHLIRELGMRAKSQATGNQVTKQWLKKCSKTVSFSRKYSVYFPFFFLPFFLFFFLRGKFSRSRHDASVQKCTGVAYVAYFRGDTN